MPIPVLETTRLKLRGHGPDDFKSCAELWADPVVVRHIGGRPFSEQEAWSKVLRYAGLWSLLGYGYWAIEEKASGKFIGEAGFADFKRELDPPIAGVPEIGWALSSFAHGRGFATEALSAILAWADQTFAWERTVCLIGSQNTPSLRLAAKHGYREVGPVSYQGTPLVLFERAHLLSTSEKADSSR
jgi:RimJ/RimL family protein N-acetyltransferase